MAERFILEPTFIMSLDVELVWGEALHPTSKTASLLRNDDTRGRGNIDLLLSLFEKYNIPATWAIVGHLFLDCCEREDGVPHHGMPRFKDGWYSADPCSNIQQDPLYYGRDIIEKVMSSPVGHEIGYHSFSHVPFSECSREVAEAEIEAGLKLAKEFGIALESFVFPYNKIGHLDVLKEKGFKIYRGEDLGAIIDQSFPIGMIGGAINKIMAPPVQPKWMEGIWEIPSSMFFGDRQFPFRLVPKAKTARMGINRTIQEAKIFHVYLHPGDLFRASLAHELDKLLAYVWEKREAGHLAVSTLGTLASHLNSQL